MLELHGVSKSFGGIHAVYQVTLEFPPNKITAVIGPNGAGKTTLFNLITGFLKPDEGQVNYFGVSLNGLTPHKIVRSGIMRTFQDLRLIRQMSVWENLLLSSENKEGIDDILMKLGLNKLKTEFAGNMSYGQQKLLSIGCCLAGGAKYLLLDEPVAGVHPDMIERILSLLRNLKKECRTIVFIEHDLDAVKNIADEIVVMDDGKVIAHGPPTEVLQQQNVVEAYLE